LAFNTEQAQNGASIYAGIKQLIRHSPYVNADETGWRGLERESLVMGLYQ